MTVITSKLIVALVDQLSAPARGVARVVKDLQAASRSNAMQLDQMRGRMVDAAAAAYALGRALIDPVGKAVAFESAMADVAKVSDFDPAGLRSFSQELRRLSVSEIPLAATELAALAENAAAAGVADTDLLEFTRGTAKAALAWGVTGAQAGEDLAKIREGLQLTIDETMLYADAINHLADRTASTAPDLTNFAKRVAVQGEFFGFTKEQSLAFGSAMISAGADTEVAATSFRNMGRALTKGESSTKRVSEAYKTLGLDAAKVAKGMQQDAVGTTIEVIQRLGQIPEHMQAAVMSDLFGDEARGLTPLLANVDLLQRTLGQVAETTEYAGSVQAEYSNRVATSEFTLQRLKNQLDNVALSIGNALLPAINATAAAVGPLLSQLAEWVEANPHVVQGVVTLVGSLVALRVATLGTRWAFLFLKGGVIDAALGLARASGAILAVVNPLNVVKGAVMALRFALIASGIGIAIAALAAAGLLIYNNWDGLVAFFQGFGSGLTQAIAPIMPAIQPIIDAGAQLLNWVMGLLGPIDASEAEWRGWGETVGTLVGGAIMKVIEIGQSIITFYTGFYSSVFTAIGDVAGVGVQIMQGIWDGIVAKFNEMLAWFAQWPQMILAAIGQIDIGKAFTNTFWPGTVSAPVQGHGGQTLYPVGQAPGIDGARAAGGAIAGGKTYLVGEEGPELVTASRSGFVHDAASTARMLSGGASAGMAAVTVQIGDIVITGNSDPHATADAVLAMLENKLKSALGGLYADYEFGG